MTQTPEAVTIDEVTHIYSTPEGELCALEGVDFAIAQGEFVSIVGASGCGKSTLLKIMAGLVQPTTGRVLVDGKVVERPIPQTSAVVFQEDALLPWYRISENVGLGLAARKVPKDRRAERVRVALEKVGLSGFERAYPHELSGGMRQRAALARGLVLEPKVLLLDEPFAALDEQTRNLMGQELRDLHRRVGGTMLMVTHSLTEAVLLSDHVIALSARPGRVRAQIQVELPSERVVELIDTESFGQYRHRLWEVLQDDWELAAGTGVAKA